MARVNALRAKSAENEKAKEAAKQAVSSQETLVDAVIAKADEDDKVVEEVKEVKDDTVQPEAVAVEPELLMLNRMQSFLFSPVQQRTGRELFIRIFFFPTKPLQILSVLTQRLDTSQQMTL